MHKALITLLACLLIGGAFGAYLYFYYDHRPVRLIISIISSVSIGSLMMLGIYHRHLLIGYIPYQGTKMLLMILLLIITALVGTELALLLQALFLKQPYQAFTGGSIYVLNILIVLVTGIPIYISEEWKSLLNSRLLNQQYRLLQLEQQQTLFELELLRAKINPHFLYNVHNSIAGLISMEPAKAEKLVLLLSKFFRFTLNKDSATFHSVTDELDIVNTYLQMQQIRYGKRMRYAIKADQQTLDQPVPSFILQILVENAVKHGIETSVDEGYIDLSISMELSGMVITVADSGPAFPMQPGNGMGLHLITGKLKLLYADAATLELINMPQKYVRLTLPQRNQNPTG